MRNVRLTGPMEACVRGQIESGAYADMSDVARAGSRLPMATGRLLRSSAGSNFR